MSSRFFFRLVFLTFNTYGLTLMSLFILFSFKNLIKNYLCVHLIFNKMRKIVTLLLVVSTLSACKQNEDKKDNGLEEVRLDNKTSNADIVRMPISADKPLDTLNIPKIALDESAFFFGEVTEGAIVKHSFTFKNAGNQPLLISDVRTTCGCTVPEWNRSPIPSGASDKINVTFDTKEKQDAQVKKITIIANTFPAETELILRGVVILKKVKSEK